MHYQLLHGQVAGDGVVALGAREGEDALNGLLLSRIHRSLLGDGACHLPVGWALQLLALSLLQRLLLLNLLDLLLPVEEIGVRVIVNGLGHLLQVELLVLLRLGQLLLRLKLFTLLLLPQLLILQELVVA